MLAGLPGAGVSLRQAFQAVPLVSGQEGAEKRGIAFDIEELFANRFELILAMVEPKLPGFGPPERWAEERQYLRNDIQEALAAFRRRREETLGLLGRLSAEQWQRAGVHATRGRFTLDSFLSLMAWHDDNHLDQLRRALDGTS